MNQEEWQKRGEGHRSRLRDKFFERGIASLSDAEVLEMLLTLGTPRKDCKQPARAALEKFGSLAKVLDAPRDELLTIKGIGPLNSFSVSFIQAVARRYLQDRLPERPHLHSSKEVADYLIHSMRSLNKEVLTVIMLDASHGIIDSKIVAEGTLTSNTIYPRELVKLALDNHAAAMIIAHNHPSGALHPSAADLDLTRHLFQACNLMGINLLDHLIIGNDQTPYSFADHGLMADIRRELQTGEPG
ncbi:MAG: DNA repair protein RadC [Proteobacteria bacterium]|nr:DNA repair protein RadC [Pseudomonadota bacterium]MBU1687875.1 DNA repair protein RadC [Pseudomonadota bacterium]